jgi:hypothetical protein
LINLSSNAEVLFREIETQTNPAVYIEAMANPSNTPTFESDYLDFKTRPENDPKNSKLKEIWYTALSGFANSGGGVIIWGIDARKDPTSQIDAACGVKAIYSPFAFKSLLTELLRGATDPPLAEVKIEAWELKPDEGFVVCLVPSGSFKPYRAEVSGEKQFWMRAADSFYVPSVAVLRSLFYPRLTAVFKIIAEIEASKNNHFLDTRCQLLLENIGTATATAPCVLARFSAVPSVDRHSGIQEWREIPQRDGRVLLQCERPIHPGVCVQLWSIYWRTNWIGPRSMPLRMDFSFHCENQPIQTVELQFGPEPYSGGGTFQRSATAVASES